MRNLPAHHQHQAETEKQEKQRRDAILDADDFMVRGKNVFAPEPELLVRSFMDSRMRNCVSGWLHVLNQYFMSNRSAGAGQTCRRWRVTIQLILLFQVKSALVNVTLLPLSMPQSFQAHRGVSPHFFRPILRRAYGRQADPLEKSAGLTPR